MCGMTCKSVVYTKMFIHLDPLSLYMSKYLILHFSPAETHAQACNLLALMLQPKVKMKCHESYGSLTPNNTYIEYNQLQISLYLQNTMDLAYDIKVMIHVKILLTTCYKLSA